MCNRIDCRGFVNASTPIWEERWWSTITSLSTNGTPIAKLNSLNTKTPQQITLEIHVLALALHNSMAGLNRLKRSQPSPLDNWISNDNAYRNKWKRTCIWTFDYETDNRKDTNTHTNDNSHYGFHSFPVVDWFCLFIYLWVLTFPLQDCSEFGNFVITLIVCYMSCVNVLHSVLLNCICNVEWKIKLWWWEVKIISHNMSY